MPVTIINDDYPPDAWDLIHEGTAGLLSEMRDLLFHNVAEGEGWDPRVEDGGVVALIEEASDHLNRIESAVKEARRAITEAQRTARLRAARRERSAGSARR
jgi:hypothetical protein